MLDHSIIQKLRSLDLSTNDFAVFGSGPMYAHGLKDLGHDLDIIACREAWEMAKKLGKIELTEIGKTPVITLFGGEIEIFNDWDWCGWTPEELVDTAEIIDGIKFVSLEKVLQWKKIFGRAKDVEHVKIIEEYLKNKSAKV
ncbi:MAG: hypothetical protein AAB768_02930 [Patescibacteria group bacterium]